MPHRSHLYCQHNEELSVISQTFEEPSEIIYFIYFIQLMDQLQLNFSTFLFAVFIELSRKPACKLVIIFNTTCFSTEI